LGRVNVDKAWHSLKLNGEQTKSNPKPVAGARKTKKVIYAVGRNDGRY